MIYNIDPIISFSFSSSFSTSQSSINGRFHHRFIEEESQLSIYFSSEFSLTWYRKPSATTNTLGGMLLGRFFVGTRMGLSLPVAALYVSEVSPAFVRGTYGSFTQIATCLGLMGALFIGIPAKDIVGWWRVCFWVSAIPAAVLAVLMEFCAESPHWLFKLREEELLKLRLNLRSF